MGCLNSLQNGLTIYTVEIYFVKTLNSKFIEEDICRGFKPGSRFVASSRNKGDENDMNANLFQNSGQIFQSNIEISNLTAKYGQYHKEQFSCSEYRETNLIVL